MHQIGGAMPTIRVAPRNSLALQAEDFADLVQELREAGYEVEIDQGNRQVGYGVTYAEILTVWLPSALAIAQAVISSTNWARNRLQKQRQERLQEDAEEQAKLPPRNRRRKHWEPSLRPKTVYIYGPDGEVLRILTYRTPDGEPEDETESERNQ
jgi:hypothetical protein